VSKRIARRRDIYHGQRPDEVALYPVRDAARYLGVPPATLRAWVFGQRGFQPVIRPADSRSRDLAFINLVEAHVLEALRRQHHLSLQKVRSAIAYLTREFGSDRPLIEHKLATDGLDLFVERYGQLINASREGQLGIRRVLEAYLRRIDRDERGRVLRLYPFTRGLELDEPRAIVIDPRVAFGRPVIAGTNIPTAIVTQRWKAGEPIEELARDYGRQTLEIEEALRCERAA
jgi:uncharacterized protein (DUF433 family)